MSVMFRLRLSKGIQELKLHLGFLSSNSLRQIYFIAKAFSGAGQRKRQTNKNENGKFNNRICIWWLCGYNYEQIHHTWSIYFNSS